MANNLRPADPQGLERRREEVDRREQEVAVERRQDEREQRQAAATREVAALRAEVDSLRAKLNVLYTELVHALSAVVGDLGEIISRGLNQTLDNIETKNAKMRKELFDVFDRRFSELRAELAALPTARGGAFRVASERADEVNELPNPPPPRRIINTAMSERRDRLYAELGVPPEEPKDPLDRRRRMKAEREEPEPRECVVPPTLAEIDQRIGERIAAEHQFMCDIIAEVVAHLQDEWEKGAMGPPGPSGPRGEEGPPGKLPLVKLWMAETVFYEGDVVAYDGGTFQAKRDTGQPPSHADWVCLATAGRDGKSVTVRGTFDATAEYRRLDVVAFNGGSFIALKDAPGPCPGSGWQLLASQGKRGVAGARGERGERGPKGDPGLSGVTIRDWKIDRARYVATPLMSDGREGPPLELRGLFEQFLHETR